ncbi:hypothetical protein [Clostridium ihumii]|uniref:hypothetical protein n=1 Tax=Clostridium ihumii TaxID=1470356 RepID=UPI00054F6ACD|nr:hypothetical protein [Clostridium ihumii]
MPNYKDFDLDIQNIKMNKINDKRRYPISDKRDDMSMCVCKKTDVCKTHETDSCNNGLCFESGKCTWV